MSLCYSFLLQSSNNRNLWVFCWNNWLSMFFRMMFVMMMFLLRQTLDASWFFRSGGVKILEDFSFGFLLIGNSSDNWVGDNNWTFLLLNESTKNHSFSLCSLLWNLFLNLLLGLYFVFIRLVLFCEGISKSSS